MQPNPTVKKIVYILSVIFLVGALGLIAYNMTHASNVLYVIANLLFICTIVAAAGYCVYGAKKKVATRFIVFLGLFAASLLLSCGIAAMSDSSIRPVILALMFANVYTLAVAKDLGFGKSMILGGICFAAAVALLIISFARVRLAGVINIYVTVTVLSLITNLFLLAKYENKAERGSK